MAMALWTTWPLNSPTCRAGSDLARESKRRATGMGRVGAQGRGHVGAMAWTHGLMIRPDPSESLGEVGLMSLNP